MKTQIDRNKRIKPNPYIICGIIVFLCFYVFFLIKGTDTCVIFHDQLDSEVIFYILRSQNIGTLFQTRFPEFMCGKADVSVASFGTLLFYLLMSPINAFISNMFFVRIVAFCALFALLKDFKVNDNISFMVSIMYAFLPIYSVYGLNSMGIPLVWLGIRKLSGYEDLMKSYILIGIYGLFSSLVVSGFYILPLMIVYIIGFSVCKKNVPKSINKKKTVLALSVAVIELLIIYVLSSANIIRSVLGENGFISHKVDYKLTPEPFFYNFKDLLLNGQYHAVSLHSQILCVFCVTIFGGIVIHLFNKEKEEKCIKDIRCICIIAAFIVLIALFHGLFKSKIGVDLRSSFFKNSPIIGMQFDRLYWLYPTLWYVLWGILLSVVYKMFISKRIIKVILIIIFWLIPAKGIITDSDITMNIVDSMKNGAYSSKSWSNGFCQEEFERIDRYIGKEKSTYKVVSVGIHPSVALYNGFYTLDGYSNNYDVEYKYEFGNIINKELEKKSEIYSYFWGWGNRCYAFSADIGKDITNYNLQNVNLQNPIELKYDFDKLKLMGGEYIISSVKISNDEVNLEKELLADNRKIYLYSIN